MDFKGPLHTRHKNTRAVTNTQPHTESVQHCQGRALSVDELSWSQTLQLRYSIICKRWIRVPYNYSLTEAQCNNVSVYVCVGVLERRGHILKWLHTATVPTLVCLLLQPAYKCEKFKGVCSDRDNWNSLHCSLKISKQVSWGGEGLLLLWSIWLP